MGDEWIYEAELLRLIEGSYPCASASIRGSISLNFASRVMVLKMVHFSSEAGAQAHPPPTGEPSK